MGNELIESIIEKDDASWQYIIYELVKNKQIDPWNVDIVKLTNKFLEKIEEMDRRRLYISSKVLLVAAILIKMKAEFLIEILNKKEVKEKKKEEKIVLDEEIPELIPKIPFDRERKITLEELMDALKEAIKTEERRIRRNVYLRKNRIDLSFILPRKRINWVAKIKEVYEKILSIFKKKKIEKIYFSQLVENNNKEEKISVFLPLIHLDFQKKLYLEQKSFLGDIEIKLNAGVPEPGQTGRT